VIFSESREYVENLIPKVQEFLKVRIILTLHPDKIYLKTLSSGVDFLGWVHFFDHKVLRTSTKRRMLQKLKDKQSSETLNSYFGLLRHGNTWKIKENILRNLLF